MPPEVSIDVRLRQAATQKDLEKLLKFQREARKESKIGSDEFRRNAEAEAQIKNRLHTLNVQAYGDQGKIKEAYFNSGSALRQFYMEQRVGDRTMRETAQTVRMFTDAFGIGGLGGGLDKVFGAIQQTEFAVNSLGIAAQSAGGKSASLGMALRELAGPLSAAGAVGAGVMFIASEFARLNRELGESTKKLIDLKVQLGEISRLSQLHKQSAEAAKAKPEVGLWDQVLGGIGMRLGMFGPSAAAAGKAVTDVEIQKKQAQLDLEKYYEERYGMTITGARGGAAGAGVVGRNTGIGALSPAGLPRRAGAPGPRGGRISYGVEGPDTIRGGGEIQRMGRGVMMVGEMLANSLTQGFQIGFRSGESFLQTFTQSILASMAAIAAQQVATTAVSGLLSLIPGVGTFSGIAGALGSLFGGSGQSVTPSGGLSSVSVGNSSGSMIGEMRNITNAVNGLELRVDNMGLYMSSERGRIAFERS